MTTSAPMYQPYGTCTATSETGHQSDIGAVAMSLRKCADTPHAAPARMPITAPDMGVPARRSQRLAATATVVSSTATHSACVYGLGVPAVRSEEPNSRGRWSASISTDDDSIVHANHGVGGKPRTLVIAPRTTRAVARWHGSSTKALGTKPHPCQGTARSTTATAATRPRETARREARLVRQFSSPSWRADCGWRPARIRGFTGRQESSTSSPLAKFPFPRQPSSPKR